jgi:hypothetical protein
MICELLFPSTILSVKMNRKTLVVVLEVEIYIYDISNMKLLHVIETSPNPDGEGPLSSCNCETLTWNSSDMRTFPLKRFFIPRLPFSRAITPITSCQRYVFRVVSSRRCRSIPVLGRRSYFLHPNANDHERRSSAQNTYFLAGD